MPRFCIYTILAAAVLAIAGCNKTGSSSEKPTLCVSIEPQRKMLEELADTNFRVVALLAPGANPETYDPSVSERMTAAKAQAYFTVGFLPFEQRLATGLPESVRVVNTAERVVPVTGTHSHGPGHDHGDHSDADPHVWTSFTNAKIMAQAMVKALVEIDPDNAEIYNKRLTKMTARLDSLDAATCTRLADSDVHAFAVWHPSLSYYARDYGLHQIAVGQESKEISMTNLKAIVDEAREDGVKVFFFQKEYDSRQAHSVNDAIGSQLVTIDPLAYEWEKQLTDITDALVSSPSH